MTTAYSQKFSKFQNEVKQAIEDEDDVLAAYTRFVEWLVDCDQEAGQSAKADSEQDLLLVLEESIRKLREDTLCLSDRRYLKLWLMYAKRVDVPEQVYSYMHTNNIGTVYSPFYEEYAKDLETKEKLKEANAIYQEGISKRVRGADKLKRCYAEFQERVKNGKRLKQPTRSRLGTSDSDSLRQHPLRNFVDNKISAKCAPELSQSQANNGPRFVPSTDPYIHMTQTASASGSKRPERLRFDLTLLFKDGQELCIQEARARSMGLLGKKWGPPPESSMGPPEVTSTKSGSTSKNHTSNRMNMTMNITSSFNKMGGGAEPTVTINTKEALRDVFGMYNSPERSVKIMRPGDSKQGSAAESAMPPPPPPIGSKHAPVRKVEPMTPAQAQPLSRTNTERDVFEGENANMRASFKTFVDVETQKENATPAVSKFKPFIDEENSVTPAPAKFKPFVDEDACLKPSPQITPGPRRALSLKEISTPSAPVNDSSEENHTASAKTLSSSTSGVFSKVFTPAGKMDNLPSNDSEPQQRSTLKSSIGVFRDPEPDKDEAKTAAANKQPSKNSVFGKRSCSFAVHNDADEEPPAPKPIGVFSKPNSESTLQRPPAFRPVSTVSSSQSESAVGTSSVFMKASFGNPSRNTGLGPSSGAPQRGVFTPSSSQSSLVFSTEISRPTKGLEEEVGDLEDHDSFVDDEDDGARVRHVNDEEEYVEDVFDDDQYGYGGDSYRMGGGRCGAYDVMTPIAERTCEFTMTTRAFETPSDRNSKTRQSGVDAVEAAARLAKELKEDARAEKVFTLQPKSPAPIDEDEFSDPEQDVSDVVERTGTLSLADAIVAASNFKPPNPCVPSDPQIITTLLSLFPLEAEFHDHRTEQSQLLDGIQKFTNKSRRGSSRSNSSRSSDEGTYDIELKGRLFEVKEKLGEGGFGAVFLAKDANVDEDEDDEDEYAGHYALKVVRPRNIWEYHILKSIHNTLPSSIRRSIIKPHAIYAFKDESFLVLELCRQGTLLDVVNRAAQAGVMQQGACLDELLVMFFSIELMRFIDAMHSAGYIHGDLKIDNCLLRLEEVPGVASAWSGLYQPSGEGGWCYKGIKMIDFGRTINTRLFPAGQQFIADWKTDARDCMEMNQNKPWTYQTDYFGLAGIIYCMLYGKYFESSTLVQGPDGRYKLATTFKRYWQVDIWTRLFDALLNPMRVRADGSLPICQELKELRAEMEEWLQNNCNRSSISLKGLLKKVELSTLEL